MTFHRQRARRVHRLGLTALSIDLGQVDLVRLGVVAGSVGSSSGSIDLDDFFSWD